MRRNYVDDVKKLCCVAEKEMCGDSFNFFRKFNNSLQIHWSNDFEKLALTIRSRSAPVHFI